jgi:hypothetical protein
MNGEATNATPKYTAGAKHARPLTSKQCYRPLTQHSLSQRSTNTVNSLRTHQHTHMQYTNHGINSLTKNISQQPKASNYETITTHPSLERVANKRQKATHHTYTYKTNKSETIYTPYDVLEVQDHRHINNHTTHLVTQGGPRAAHTRTNRGMSKRRLPSQAHTPNHTSTMPSNLA